MDADRLDDAVCLLHGSLVCEPCAYDRGHATGVREGLRQAADEGIWMPSQSPYRDTVCAWCHGQKPEHQIGCLLEKRLSSAPQPLADAVRLVVSESPTTKENTVDPAGCRSTIDVWEIIHGPRDSDVTHACTEHVGYMLTDAPHHEVHPAPVGAFCCYMG